MAIDTTYLDADSDKIKLARPSLLAAVQRLNDIEAQTSGNGASHIGFLPSGASATARTAFAKLSDIVSTSDYSSLGAALTAAGNKPVHDPLGITHKNTFTLLSNPFLLSGGTDWGSAHIMRSAENAGSHAGLALSTYQIESRPIGSGSNGPTSADYGLTISLLKQNFDTTSTVGELDGLNIVVRNGGANSDATCWLGNVAHYGTGFAAVFEAQSSIVAASTVTKQIQIQGGVSDNVSNNYTGYFANANVGALNDAFRCDNTAGASWSNFFLGIKDGVQRIRIAASGDIYIAGATGGKKMVGVASGTFRIVNDAGTQELLTIADAGDISAFGPINAASFKVGSVQVVGARDGGWAAMTGTGNKATIYDTSTITLQQLAQRVNSIQAMLTTHGLIGA